MSRPGMPEFPFGQQGQGAMAHQGSSNLAEGIIPNTRAAFERAVQLGSRGIELDTITSIDGETFVYHGSATDEEKVQTGLERRDVLEELDAAEIVARLPHVPRLEEVITTFSDRFFNIDLETERAASRGPLLVARLGLLDQVNFASFHSNHLRIAAETLGDGDADVGYQRVSMSGGIEESLALLDAAFTKSPAAFDLLQRSKASRLQIPYEIIPPKHHAAPLLQKVFGIDVGDIPPDDQGESALAGILSAGIFNEEAARNAIVKVQVSAGMVALAHGLGFGLDIWTLKEKSHTHHAVEVGADWLITEDIPYTQKAIEEHRAAA